MSYCNCEEEFLSVYTATKLIRGGKPEISSEELEAVRNEFMLSVYCNDSLIKPLANLNFSDLESINEKFQQKASKHRSWLKPCFTYENGKLYPTYTFSDYTQTTNGEFIGFLADGRFNNSILTDPIDSNIFNADIKHLPTAQTIADYFTQVFAKKYINMEIDNRKWPIHMDDISNIFDKDLGKILELQGTKEYFDNFNKQVLGSVANLLTENNGNLILSDKKAGDLKFNNFRRIIAPIRLLDRLYCTSHNDIVGETHFDISIENNNIKCYEQTLVDYDKFEDDYVYNNEEKDL